MAKISKEVALTLSFISQWLAFSLICWLIAQALFDFSLSIVVALPTGFIFTLVRLYFQLRRFP